MTDAIHYMPARNVLLVQVRTDAGLVGLGESAAYGGSLESMAAVVEHDLRPIIVGQDAARIERLWQMMAGRPHQRGTRGMLRNAISGIDIALWDIMAQAARMPLWRMLGGYRDRLDAYASAGFYAGDKTADALAAEVASYAERGFRGVKIKVGRQPDALLNPLVHMDATDYATVSFEEDVARVRAARRAIGRNVMLAIDANNAFTAPAAVRFARAVEDQAIAWFEEPVATEDIDGSADVARQLDMPVAGYETETSLAGYRELLARRAVDIAQPDVIWSGGVTESRRIAALAQAYAAPVIPHVFSSAVSTAANMAFIASIPNGSWLEQDQNPNALRTELFNEPLDVCADGTIAMPERPGLGYTLNEATIERYRVPEREA